ncbi:MAG TPA: DNA translocase FtsK 4TM domain-containing protein [Candidatus Limnocylindria bacterium]|nr:DNA translocase FtsK 4TM domain-containing protein [Candidatus Limnocylindria bacterium]
MAERKRSPSTTRRRPANGRRASSRRRGTGLNLPPHIARSLVGLSLLVLGAVSLIALLLPEAGMLNRYVTDVLRPAFGQGAWLLAVLLLVAGIFVERAPKVGPGWTITAVGGLVVFLGGLGIIHLLWGRGSREQALRDGGGVLGNALSSLLSDLLSAPGAFVVLLGMVLAGLILMLNVTLMGLLRPVTGGGRMLASAISTPARAAVESATARRAEETTRQPARRPDNGRSAKVAVPVLREPTPLSSEVPSPLPSPAPVSQTVWAAGPAQAVPAQAVAAQAAVAVATPAGTAEESDEEIERGPDDRDYQLPSVALLDAGAPPATGAVLDHGRNIRIIEDKLLSFQIPATVTGTNTGPVVTQYEVRPDARIKLSRIEALADDLAMALAARSIRIEAPIPGRDVVGIEIPNHSSEIVGFRQLLEDSGMLQATSKLTFALGRDVSGKPYAVDLARMPHLLIAGATGSGKSVCVNALITSLLMRTTPAELRLIVIDLKRVELAAYRDLPHLLTQVIVEAHHARAALGWAVAEMERRYETLANASERNITAYNANAERRGRRPMEYLVIVIDELADLIMREGRKVEDPVVKIAQKARAVGIHLVLATQRPSVNVVTGLIKANVPSRIAFAMSSNVDSRTVLDAPGAEDLIGRGDMLYQPADLPRPVRLQGVFVNDAEVHAVTDFWRAQAEPDYDNGLLESEEGESSDGGQFGWLARLAEDDLTARAAELVMQTGKASTSMMQTKLKIGFNRATRLMDELERFGIVGPLDPRNPAVPRQVFGPDNWVRGTTDADFDN